MGPCHPGLALHPTPLQVEGKGGADTRRLSIVQHTLGPGYQVHTCSPAPLACPSSTTGPATSHLPPTPVHSLWVPALESLLFSILTATAGPISSSEPMKASTHAVHTPPAASHVISRSRDLNGTYR